MVYVMRGLDFGQRVESCVAVIGGAIGVALNPNVIGIRAHIECIV